MDKNKIIGKEVWVLEEKNYSWKPNKTKTWKVKDYIDWGDERLTDYTPHAILEDAEGNTKDIRAYEVVVIPNANLKGANMVSRYLNDNSLYTDDVSDNSEGSIRVEISWGDWKHDHGYLRNLMQYIGYGEGDEIVTEENGSDCYSSIHFFYKETA